MNSIRTRILKDSADTRKRRSVLVSMNSIRTRILKGRGRLAILSISSGFNEFDPNEDTERVADGGATRASGEGFNEFDPNEDTERSRAPAHKARKSAVSMNSIRTRILKECARRKEK